MMTHDEGAYSEPVSTFNFGTLTSIHFVIVDIIYR